MKRQVLSGDISKVPADALITAINSGGLWFGGIDGVIQRCAGDMFHNQAANAMPLKNGDTVVAKGKGSHNGEFKNVLFVIDDLQSSLGDIIKIALDEASKSGFKNVTLPAVRMGVMMGAVEKTHRETMLEIVRGINLHEENGSNIETLTFVIYNDPQTVKELPTLLLEN